MQVTWDAVGSRIFEAGVDRGVIYLYDEDVSDNVAVPWNGLISVVDASVGGDVEPYYLDGVKFLNRRRATDYAGKLTAFTYPPEFDRFLGVAESESGIRFHDQETNDMFGLSYRTRIGNDLDSTGHGYKIHLLYNLSVSMDDISHSTMGTEITPSNFSWDLSGIPVHFSGRRPTSHVVIDSTSVSPTLLAQIESVIYGTNNTTPRLPTPAEFNEWL